MPAGECLCRRSLNNEYTGYYLIDKYYNMVIKQFLTGFLDSLRLEKVLAYMLASKKIRRSFSYCFLVNVLIFTGMAFTKEYLLSQLLPPWVIYLLYNPVLLVTYLVSNLVSGFWFADIAEEALRLEAKSRKSPLRSESVTLQSRVDSEMQHLLILVCFLVQVICNSIVSLAC